MYRQKKPRICLNNVTLTLLNMNRCNWKWFNLETILNNNYTKKHCDLTIILACMDNRSLETVLIMSHLPYLTWTDVTESDASLMQS